MRYSSLALLIGAVLALSACQAPTQPSPVETAGALKALFLAEGLAMLEARPMECTTFRATVRCDVCLATASASRPDAGTPIAVRPVLVRADFQRRSSGWKVLGSPKPLPDAGERCAPETASDPPR